MVPYDREHFYVVMFRPRRTRRQYHELPRKGQGRIKNQVNGAIRSPQTARSGGRAAG